MDKKRYLDIILLGVLSFQTNKFLDMASHHDIKPIFVKSDYFLKTSQVRNKTSYNSHYNNQHFNFWLKRK